VKRHLTIAVALLALCLTASAAYAAGLDPATGAWKGKAGSAGEFVSFKVKKTSGGKYQASSARLFVVAPCKAPNPNDSTTVRGIRVRGLTVKLSASGQKLKGSRTLTFKRAGGKATETVKTALTFTSARRAKAVVKAKYDTKANDPTSNSADCSGRLAVTAKPQ
jgi:hypothetical protein